MTNSLSTTAAADHGVSGQPAKPESVVDILKSLIWAVVIALTLRTLIFTPFNIPSASMEGNLLTGDYLIVSKFSYGFSRYSLPFGPDIFSGRILQRAVKRGDVVVFKWPVDPHKDYIKRIVGLPGDRIQVRDGVLYINDMMVKKERLPDYIKKVSPNTQCEDYPQYEFTLASGNRECHIPQYRETMPAALGGASYTVLDLNPTNPRDNTDNTRVYVVPPRHYFGMGDNRDNSSDSRVPPSQDGVGYIPEENLVGRAVFRFFSTDGSADWWNPVSWFSAIRWNRLFTAIK